MTRTISAAGKAFIQTREGYGLALADGQVQSYPDPGTGGAPWTIGWGSTGPDIVKGTIWTRAQAQARFDSHMAEFATGVDRLIGTAPTRQNQFDAMVSLAYNIGLTGFGQSTVLRKHKAGDYAGAAAAFALWNKAGGQVMQGLVNRRAAEAKVYATP